MNNKQREELEKIRYYKGSVKDFKSFWDAQAGINTNAYGTPEYQGYDVYPTRGAHESPHWKNTLEEEIEIGNEDEIGMLIGDLLTMERSVTELKNILTNLSSSGKVDFPHWWQSKIVKAKDYVLIANEYLKSELNKNGNS
jgi:hypothetical protein